MYDGILSINEINNVPVIIDLIPTSNYTSRPNINIIPKHITIHNTGNSNKNADADMHTEYVDNHSGYISWHFTVDDEKIYQELPVTELGYHSGSSTGNYNSIGIEICENIDGNYNKAEENAIALIIYLMKQLSIQIDNIYPHQHWSGKYCPHKILDSVNGWSGFLARIEEKIIEKDVSLWAKDAWEWAKENGINDGKGAKNSVTEEQDAVFSKRLYDLIEKMVDNKLSKLTITLKED